MRVSYERLIDPDHLPDRIRALSPKTVVFDVEPLVAGWDTDRASLVQGVTKILDWITDETVGVQLVAFATNSWRRLSPVPARSGLRVLYLAAAAKPLRTAPYRHLPPPGVVIGDQLATDGVLAWRLGYSFLHFRPPSTRLPLGPRIMDCLGRPLLPLLFARP